MAKVTVNLSVRIPWWTRPYIHAMCIVARWVPVDVHQVALRILRHTRIVLR